MEKRWRKDGEKIERRWRTDRDMKVGCSWYNFLPHFACYHNGNQGPTESENTGP